ncbi:MAG: hypothetical protein AAFY34_07335 [Pseudomonadota bacterium]
MGAATAGCGLPGQAQSFLDSDFFCRVKGCVIVHDGFTFDVYDAHIFSNNGTVAPGGQLIPWTGNPFQGSGDVNPVFTGTRTEGFHILNDLGEGVPFTLSSGGQTISTDLDASGILDANDTLNSFSLTPGLSVGLLETAIQRSFYISSRTVGIRIRAAASLRGVADPFNSSANLSRVFFDYGLTPTGNDDGMPFGAAAQIGGFTPLGDIDDLGSLSGTGAFIAEFPLAIRSRNDPSQAAQSIRFDYVYGFENYDLSLGAGELQYQIEFDFFRN